VSFVFNFFSFRGNVLVLRGPINLSPHRVHTNAAKAPAETADASGSKE
jgi:hypothetical protein